MLRLRAYAKINLSLRVLHKRPDGFHELRTIFQTISLADRMTVDCQRARRSAIELDDRGLGLQDNLMLRAADLYLKAAQKNATIHMTLDKRIPMGGGLGGGSTDAATVLLALHHALPSKRVDLAEIAAQLGSDVPFFLEGGTALGLGRGEELYPLPDLARDWGVIAAPDVHVSTPQAYQALGRTELTSPPTSRILKKFQALSRSVAAREPRSVWQGLCENDFEAAVFLQYPVLKQLRDKLERLGAQPARLTGSGAALFGLFDSRSAADKAAQKLSQSCRAYSVSLVSRSRYRAQWPA